MKSTLEFLVNISFNFSLQARSTGRFGRTSKSESRALSVQHMATGQLCDDGDIFYAFLISVLERKDQKLLLSSKSRLYYSVLDPLLDYVSGRNIK